MCKPKTLLHTPHMSKVSEKKKLGPYGLKKRAHKLTHLHIKRQMWKQPTPVTQGHKPALGYQYFSFKLTYDRMRATKVRMKYKEVNQKWKFNREGEQRKKREGGHRRRDGESELAKQRGMSSVLRRR